MESPFLVNPKAPFLIHDDFSLKLEEMASYFGGVEGGVFPREARVGSSPRVLANQILQLWLLPPLSPPLMCQERRVHAPSRSPRGPHIVAPSHTTPGSTASSWEDAAPEQGPQQRSSLQAEVRGGGHAGRGPQGNKGELWRPREAANDMAPGTCCSHPPGGDEARPHR